MSNNPHRHKRGPRSKCLSRHSNLTGYFQLLISIVALGLLSWSSLEHSSPLPQTLNPRGRKKTEPESIHRNRQAIAYTLTEPFCVLSKWQSCTVLSVSQMSFWKDRKETFCFAVNIKSTRSKKPFQNFVRLALQ